MQTQELMEPIKGIDDVWQQRSPEEECDKSSGGVTQNKKGFNKHAHGRKNNKKEKEHYPGQQA